MAPRAGKEKGRGKPAAAAKTTRAKRNPAAEAADAAKVVTTTGAAYVAANAPEPAPETPAAEPRRPTTEEVREAHFRRLMAAHREHDRELEKFRDAMKARGKLRTETRNALKQAGFYLENVDNVLRAAAVTEGRSKEQDKVDQLAWMRDLEGLPNPRSGEQLDLLNRLPETEREGKTWDEDGYHRGVIDEPCEIPAGCPPIFHQRWVDHWHKGRQYVRDLEARTQNAGPEPEPAPAPEEPEVDLNAAARKLRNDPGFMDRSAPEDPDDAPELTDAMIARAEVRDGESAFDGFDAEAVH